MNRAERRAEGTSTRKIHQYPELSGVSVQYHQRNVPHLLSTSEVIYTAGMSAPRMVLWFTRRLVRRGTSGFFDV